MNAAALSIAIRDRASRIGACDGQSLSYGELADAAELLRVLARVVEGRDAARAFGSPGDWGYNTPIGAALAASPDEVKGGRK